MQSPTLIPKALVIFIIDDDEDDQQLLSEALLTVNPRNSFYFSCNAVDGLKSLRNGLLSRPDLIFVDINMPLLDGKQFLKIMKEDILLKDIPIVIYSTSCFETEVKELLALGAQSFLQKSVDFNVLEKSLHSIISALQAQKGISF